MNLIEVRRKQDKMSEQDIFFDCKFLLLKQIIRLIWNGGIENMDNFLAADLLPMISPQSSSTMETVTLDVPFRPPVSVGIFWFLMVFPGSCWDAQTVVEDEMVTIVMTLVLMNRKGQFV